MSSSQEESSESEERLLQSVYDHMLQSVVIVYASNMHEMIKTGGISASELQTPSSRQEIFPALYKGKTPEEIQAQLDTFATEIPTRKSRKRKLVHATPASSGKNTDESDEENKDEDEDGDEDDDDDEDFKDETVDDGGKVVDQSSEGKVPVAAIANGNNQDRQPPGVDVWGRIPPKEPKLPIQCTLCGRHLSTSRFASHLEKCMGLSTRPLPGIPNRNVGATNGLK